MTPLGFQPRHVEGDILRLEDLYGRAEPDPVGA
jgi:hypothetical protein